jgi:hypothetical protein
MEEITIETTTWNRPNPTNADAELLEHGVCAWTPIAETVLSRRREASATEPGEQWHVAEVADATRPVRIDGLALNEVGMARGLLADTVRAHRVHSRLMRRRRDHARRLISEFAAAEARALATRIERGLQQGQSDQQYVSARAHTDRLLARYATDAQVVEDTAEAEELAGFAAGLGISDDRVRRALRSAHGELERWRLQTPDDPVLDPRMPLYLGVGDIADRIGVTAATVRSYRSRHDIAFPTEDITIGGSPAWTWDTIEHWIRGRYFASSARHQLPPPVEQ